MTKEIMKISVEVIDGAEAYTENEVTEFREQYIALMESISDVCVQKKQLEEKEKEMKEKLKQAMEDFEIKSIDNEILKITYIAPTTSTTIDSKKLKAELPDIASNYSKTSSKSGYVKIAVK